MSMLEDRVESRKTGSEPRRSIAKAVAISRAIGWVLMMMVVIGISYVILLPLFTKLSSSFMMEGDLYDNAVKWIPRHFTLDNYKLVWELMEYPRAFFSSAMLGLAISVLQTASCTLVGYGLARFDVRGSGIAFALVMLTLLVPPHVLMTSLYLNFRYFNIFGLLPEPINLMNTYYPAILMSMTATGIKNGLFIYIMRQLFRGMPGELEEAAYVDGAGLFTTFHKVMLPSAKPALVIVFLFSFVWQWNDYFYTSLLMSGSNLLPVALQGLASKYVESLGPESTSTTDYMVTSQYLSILDNAAMMLFMAPLLILYAFMQRHFVQSIERAGLVG